SGRLDAVVPVQVQVSDDAGREAEGTGYYGAVDGKLTLDLDIAPNDKPGQWRIQVTELASGTQATSDLTVR
ncbi:MAG: hypothetical protein KAI66_22680, partial [Lentisphaeria bacterium]|nr:hypothetical protein [Lentisphaeria bacterium]